LYVWGSVLVVLGLLLAEVLQLAWQRRSLLRALKASA